MDINDEELDNINTIYDSNNFHEYNSSKKLVDVILKIWGLDFHNVAFRRFAKQSITQYALPAFHESNR